MKKEKFLYELVDNYLYMVNLGCMVMENFSLIDRTRDYTNCADCLEDCLDFYDQLYDHLDSQEYSIHEVDAILNHLVQALKEQTVQAFIWELNNIIKEYLPEPEDFLKKHLLQDKDGKPQTITATTLLEFLKCFRAAEVSYAAK